MIKALKIKDFPDYYITDTGEVYSRKYHPINNKNNRIKKINPRDRGNGYLFVRLSKNNKPFPLSVHRLVAQAFIPNPENKPQVNHINGNRADNRVENLEWCTQSENNIHMYRYLGCKPNKPMKGKLGKDCPNSKPVLQIKDGKIIREFCGAKEAERHTGIKNDNINHCLRSKTKSAGGYEWRYKQ